MKNKTSTAANGLIWFGAGVSIAEILTGTYYAGMGFGRGVAAILLGHVIGCLMLFLAGLIGAKTKKSAMETVKLSFGEKGSLLFSVLNVLQLLGWTAIMIYDGALAADGVFAAGAWVWCLVIGGLIILWIAAGVTSLKWVSTAAMTALFLMTLVLCVRIFGEGGQMAEQTADAMSFGAAVELAVAMPLSWIPLISDYTREAEKPVAATAVSAAVYGVVSCFMYLIGMGAAELAGESDFARILLHCGLGVIGLLIVVLSTVTTTFLDAYSAGVSSVSICGRLSEKWVAVVVAAVGTAAAILYPMDNITDFLYLIGSVFAPMAAIQFTDYFVLGKRGGGGAFNWRNLVIWFVGFLLCRWLMTVDIVVGNTLPAMIVTGVLCVAVEKMIPQASK